MLHQGGLLFLPANLDCMAHTFVLQEYNYNYPLRLGDAITETEISKFSSSLLIQGRLCLLQLQRPHPQRPYPREPPDCIQQA